MTACSLVTGCAGFIGSHVAKVLLEQGHSVIGLDDLSGGFPENLPGGVHFIQGSVCDAAVVGSVFRSRSIDYVFHLAAYAAEARSHFIRRFNYHNNLVGSATLINEAVKAGSVRCFTFTSSIAVYGYAAPPVDESAPTIPADPYGVAKLAVELDLAAAHHRFGLPFIVFRPHNVYGPSQNIWDCTRNVVGIFMRQLLNGEPMSVFGDGLQTRAFTYIDDVAPTIAYAAQSPGCHNTIFNIGADEPRSIIDVAHLTAAALDVQPRIRYLSPRHEPTQVFARHDRLRERFGQLRPLTPLADGLARMARWVRTQPRRQPRSQPPSEVGQLDGE